MVYKLFTVDGTIGSAFIGFAMSCALFGIFCGQIISYFRKYPNDRPAYKLMIVLLGALEITAVSFIGHFIYYYTIMQYGDPLALVTTEIVWTAIAQVILSSLVGAIVKFCFTMRVWRFSGRNIYITGVISLFILAHAVLGILFVIRAFELRRFIFIDKLNKIATASLSFGVITDTSIALILCFYLKGLRRTYPGPASTLTVYAISTGALTSAVSLVTLVLYNAYPTSFYFMASYFILARLHAISFLAALNTRKIVKGQNDTQGSEKGIMSKGAIESSYIPSHSKIVTDSGQHVEVAVLHNVVVSSEQEKDIL